MLRPSLSQEDGGPSSLLIPETGPQGPGGGLPDGSFRAAQQVAPDDRDTAALG